MSFFYLLIVYFKLKSILNFLQYFIKCLWNFIMRTCFYNVYGKSYHFHYLQKVTISFHSLIKDKWSNQPIIKQTIANYAVNIANFDHVYIRYHAPTCKYYILNLKPNVTFWMTKDRKSCLLFSGFTVLKKETSD